MLNISRKTKVFVFSPSSKVTGGVELLHQLVDVLNKSGIEAFIVYLGADKAIPEPYRGYHIKTSEAVDDQPEHIVVMCEGGMFDESLYLTRAQLVFWWLSVDNFYFGSIDKLKFTDYINWDLKIAMKILAKKLLRFQLPSKGTISIDYLKKLKGVHCYQSEYAHQYLLKQGFKNLFPLSDYINGEYNAEGTAVKEDIVLYNPVKGIKFTNKLRALAPDIQWIPLINLQRHQLLNLLQRSKLYIDFGEHPGKDRIPREAALSGCCVITGMKGSAGYHEDIPISNFYKIADSGKNVHETALARIRQVLQDFTKHTADFEEYRMKIRLEEQVFTEEVKKLFNMNQH